MAKFKPGDKVIISKDSKNIWIRGKKGTIIHFLEENNVPGSSYQWTYEVKLEDGDKSYIPQWEMILEEGAAGTAPSVTFEATEGEALNITGKENNPMVAQLVEAIENQK